MDNPPPPLPAPPRIWWQRNWPWAVPTGCLSLLFAFAVLGGGIMLTVLNVMKSSDVYRTAVRRAKTNAQVADALGTPIKLGFFLTGNINVFNDAGRASLAIPITGSKRKGTIYVVAKHIIRVLIEEGEILLHRVADVAANRVHVGPPPLGIEVRVARQVEVFVVDEVNGFVRLFLIGLRV